MPFLIPVLALAIFAQGTSEFMLAGLLLPLSSDLGVEPAQAGLLTSSFAVGMVVGAPVVAVFGARWRPRRTLVLLLLAFILAHAVGAVSTSFWVLLTTRVIAALANAGFLAIALSTVRSIVSPGQTTRAVATLLSGTTLATIVGVPAGALLAGLLGWRSTFWGVAVLCLPAILGLLLDRTLGRVVTTPRVRVCAELNELRRRSVLVPVILAVLVNAATFGVFTFLGVIGADAGVEEPWVPALLAAFGIGAFLGVSATARWAAARERAWIAVGGFAATALWALLAFGTASATVVFAGAFLGGMLSFAVGSALISRIVREATGAPVLGGAYATVALNLGAMAGPAFAASVYSGAGAQGIGFAAAALTAAAASLAHLLPTSP
jgi:DHA1 family chloramphenicol resistance protein-like MFS transporter